MDNKKYRFVFVDFEFGTREYSYLCEDEKLGVNSLVVVPVGKSNREKTAKIIGVQFADAENAPYPMDKIKSVIRAANAEEAAAFVDWATISGKVGDFDALDKFEELWEYFSFLDLTYEYDEKNKTNSGDFELIISLSNDRSDRNIAVRIGNAFSLSFYGWEADFEASEFSYRNMISIIIGMIANNICVLEISSGDFLLGYMLTHKNKLDNNLFTDIIEPSTLYRDCQNELCKKSLSVNAYFWDKKYDRKMIFNIK